MLPYIVTPYGNIEMFAVMVVLGALAFICFLHSLLLAIPNHSEEEIYILPKTVYSALFAIVIAALADALFKIKENNGFLISGITFYGGLVGATVATYIQLHFSKSQTQCSIRQWFDILTQPLIVFHIFGRIGCFLGGCCYGKATNSFLGVYFPDNEIEKIFHYGKKCYPTQLFEVFALLIILAIISRSQKKFETYLALYAFSRFFIEFFRGDYRGNLFGIISPAQLISLIIILIVVMHNLLSTKNNI